MVEAKEEALDVSYPRKLDFNLPLLSTRRLGSNPDEDEASCTSNKRLASRDTSNRIPFSWEQAPGKPKIWERNDISNEDVTPRLRLPPCRWHLQMHQAAIKDDDAEYLQAVDVDDRSDGRYGADIDDDQEDRDAFLDAVDVLSLTEAIDIAQKADDEEHAIDRLTMESVKSTDSQSPNYMIERFLPDATALAASSAFFAMSDLNNRLPYNYPEECSPGAVGGPCSSGSSLIRVCGLENLFSWRMKHKLCGVKSPVRQLSPNVRPHHHEKPRKQKHNYSSWPLRDAHKDK